MAVHTTPTAKILCGWLPDGLDAVTYRGMIVVDDRLSDEHALAIFRKEFAALPVDVDFA